MTASTFILHRYEDKSGVSGTGMVAEGVEWSDGWVALHWPGEHPSTATWKDIRGVEAVHGHNGLTVVEYAEPARLLKAYEQVVMWLLSAAEDNRPMRVEPHPDWPDRLLLTFRDARVWSFWTALFDGSTDAATHEEVAGRIVTTWVNPEGNLWLTYSVDGTFEDLLAGETYDEHPLQRFHEEDR